MGLSIAQAGLEDLPALAEINRAAYYQETIAQFAFKNWPDKANMFDFFKARLAERFSHANSQIFKAIDTATGFISGFICLTLEGAGKEPVGVAAQEPAPDLTPTAKMMQQIPPYFNQEFVVKTGAEVEQLKSLMNGEEHYYLSAFAVDPCQQGKGIGSQLMKHCLDIADQSSFRTWLIAFPGSHSLYLRFGFKDVEYRDVDLNAWDKGRLRGYGVYRQYAMVRGGSQRIEKS